MTRYLLPCECGNQVPVSVAQAGQTVHCSCGRSLAVPTMFKIKALELAEPESERLVPTSDWGARQRVILVGIVVLLVSGILLGFFRWGKPVPPAKILETDFLEEQIESLTLIQTFQLWDALRQGLSMKWQVDAYYEARLAAYHRRMGVTLVFFGLGLLTVVIGFFLHEPGRTIDELGDVDETPSPAEAIPPG